MATDNNSDEEVSTGIAQQAAELKQIIFQLCNTVLLQAKLGFHLMEDADPNIHDIERAISWGLLPILERLTFEGDFDPLQHIQLDTLRQYGHHLKQIAKSILRNDEDMFNKYIERLRNDIQVP